MSESPGGPGRVRHPGGGWRRERDSRVKQGSTESRQDTKKAKGLEDSERQTDTEEEKEEYEWGTAVSLG